MAQARTQSALHEARLRREASGLRKLADSTWREDRITALLASLLILGLFLDGWNHINLQNGELGGFFTEWHGLLYLGFSATALWVITRNSHLYRPDVRTPPGARPILGVPLRYPLAVAGIALATVGLIGDLVWHEAFGEEVGVARVIGPFHIVLFTGAGLLITGPFRSAWHDLDSYPVGPSFRTMLPPLLSLMLITAMAAFLFQWLSAFIAWDPALEIDRLPAGLGGRAGLEETVEIAGGARVVVTNLVLMSALLFTLRRWRLPFGSATFLFTGVALLMSTLTEFREGWTVLAAAAGGLAADALIQGLRASPARPATHRIAAVVTPIVLWSAYFAVLTLLYDVVWPRDLALGTVCLASLGGLLVSVLVLPPSLPRGAWDVPAEEGRGRAS
jgi:hypothetical protein